MTLCEPAPDEASTAPKSRSCVSRIRPLSRAHAKPVTTPSRASTLSRGRLSHARSERVEREPTCRSCCGRTQRVRSCRAHERNQRVDNSLVKYGDVFVHSGQCRRCQECQRCRGALHAIARAADHRWRAEPESVRQGFANVAPDGLPAQFGALTPGRRIVYDSYVCLIPVSY